VQISVSVSGEDNQSSNPLLVSKLTGCLLAPIAKRELDERPVGHTGDI
jgi:hypothetical protein